MNSGTDGGNSDIGVLADFSDDEEESQVEQFSGCRIPGCQCEGRIEYMEWGSEDMTDTDDSEWEDPDERENRLYVERYNLDLFEGMTPLTYTPPTRKYRRRRYEDRVRYGPEIQETAGRNSELGFQTDEETPNSELTVQPRTLDDEDIPTGGDQKDNRGRRRRSGSDADISSEERSDLFDRPVTESVTAWTGSDSHFPSDEHSKDFGRPVTESVSAWAGSDTDFTSGEDLEFFGRPVTESMAARAGSNTDYPSGEHLKFRDRPVTESVTARAADTEELFVMNVSTVTIELSQLRARVLGETDMRDIPVYKENCTPRRRQPEKVLPSAHVQVVRIDNQWNSRDYCVCKKADSVNRSGTGSCWNCLCWIVWGYRVSCLAAIVIKDRLHGIDLFTEDRRVCTNRQGLGGNPITSCDIIRVYTKMNENFKGGINNVMLRNNDPVDSRDHQRCVDNRHWSWTHASVRGKPIREKGRFGCMDTPVR